LSCQIAIQNNSASVSLRWRGDAEKHGIFTLNHARIEILNIERKATNHLAYFGLMLCLYNLSHYAATGGSLIAALLL
jgi:hypothetical protein